jgi:lipid II:glycine glycyltransferase (peptidoglycan interpeptide bridge formation enzyme)
MPLTIKEITEKNTWEEFLSGCAEKTFLHSWNWGEFQKKEGNKIWRQGVYGSDNKLAAVALVVKIKARRGTFLFIPHGPIASGKSKTEESRYFKILLDGFKKLGKEEKADFIRVAPILERTKENTQIFKSSGFRKAPIHMHPEVTWELDISKPEEEILSGMRKTTRYLIRQAQKNNDIEIIKIQNKEGLKTFYEVHKETSLRHKFVPFSLKYIENEFDSLKDDNQISIFLGKYKSKVVSSAIVVYWQDAGFYHHGASLSEYNKVPVSYLLQWEAIKEAKARGCLAYNFWGIAPDIKKESDVSKSKHPWSGLSLFKMGFGGKIKEYVATQDFPLSNKYLLNYIIEKIRKAKRGL